jgi:hypothetical protein
MNVILNLVIDQQITTKEQAAALVEEEVAEMVAHSDLSAEEARKRLLANIGYVTGYLAHKQADYVMELFDTEHPVFGRTHPTPEDACRMGMEYAAKRRTTNCINPNSNAPNPDATRSTTTTPTLESTAAQPTALSARRN